MTGASITRQSVLLTSPVIGFNVTDLCISWTQSPWETETETDWWGATKGGKWKKGQRGWISAWVGLGLYIWQAVEIPEPLSSLSATALPSQLRVKHRLLLYSHSEWMESIEKWCSVIRLQKWPREHCNMHINTHLWGLLGQYVLWIQIHFMLCLWYWADSLSLSL